MRKCYPNSYCCLEYNSHYSVWKFMNTQLCTNSMTIGKGRHFNGVNNRVLLKNWKACFFDRQKIRTSRRKMSKTVASFTEMNLVQSQTSWKQLFRHAHVCFFVLFSSVCFCLCFMFLFFLWLLVCIFLLSTLDFIQLLKSTTNYYIMILFFLTFFYLNDDYLQNASIATQSTGNGWSWWLYSIMVLRDTLLSCFRAANSLV